MAIKSITANQKGKNKMRAIKGHRVVFYVPVLDESYVQRLKREKFRAELMRNFQGITAHKMIIGFWKGKDKTYKDKITPLEVAGIPSLLVIEEIAQEIKDKFNQEAVYLVIDGKAYLHE